MARKAANRTEVIQVRLSAEEAALLRRIQRQSRRSRSDIVREGIRRVARERVFDRWIQDTVEDERRGRRWQREPRFEGR